MIKFAVKQYGISNVLLAYGNLIEYRKYLPQTLLELKNMLSMMKAFVIDFNKSGHPKHPLYSKIGKLKKWDCLLEYIETINKD